MIEPLRQSKIREQLDRPVAGLTFAQAFHHLRQHDVLQSGKLWQQVMRLIDEADLRAANARALRITELRGRLIADEHLTAVLALQQPGDMKERRFSGSG